MKSTRFLITIGIVIVVANIVVLDYFVFKNGLFRQDSINYQLNEAALGGVNQPYECDEECELEIATQIEALFEERLEMLQPTPTVIVREKSAPLVTPTQAPRIVYITLGNTFSTTQVDWTKVPGSDIEFDLNDYSQSAIVKWEGTLRANDANSKCFARLYDKSNNREVDYSQQTTTETSAQYLISQPLAVWAGRNKYQLDIKSLNGVTCHVDSPRLRITY